MTTKRKTSVDYRRDLEEIEKKRIGLTNRVDQRIMEMAKIHPEFIWNVNKNDSDPNTRKWRLGGGFLLYEKRQYDSWVGWWTLNKKLKLLEKIEKWSESQQKVRQMSIDEIYEESKGRHDATLKNLS